MPDKDFFSFFDLQPSFLINKEDLKKKFYANSRQYHPDFYTNQPEVEQQNILTLSSFNNDAYRILMDDNTRLTYTLKLLGVVNEEEKISLPNDFLMDMMELNEEIESLSPNDEPTIDHFKAKIDERLNQLNSSLHTLFEKYEKDPSASTLHAIKELYYCKKYFLRIVEKFSTFATR